MAPDPYQYSQMPAVAGFGAPHVQPPNYQWQPPGPTAAFAGGYEGYPGYGAPPPGAPGYGAPPGYATPPGSWGSQPPAGPPAWGASQPGAAGPPGHYGQPPYGYGSPYGAPGAPAAAAPGWNAGPPAKVFSDLWKAKFIPTGVNSTITQMGSIDYYPYPVNQMWASDDPTFDNQLITWGRKGVEVWDVGFMQSPLKSMAWPGASAQPQYRLHTMDFCPSQRIGVCSSHCWDERRAFRLHRLDLNTGQYTEIYENLQDRPISGLAILPATPLQIATSTLDDQTHGHIRIIDGTTGRPLQKTHTNFVIDLKASPTDSALVYGVIERNAQAHVDAQRIFCYDTRTSANQVSNWIGMDEPAVRSFNVPKLPGDKIVAAGGQNAYVWDIRKPGGPLHKIPGKNHHLNNRVRADLFSNILAITNYPANSQGGQTTLFLYDLNNPTHSAQMGNPDAEVIVLQDPGHGDLAGMDVKIVPYKDTIAFRWESWMYKVSLTGQ